MSAFLSIKANAAIHHKMEWSFPIPTFNTKFEWDLPLLC